MRTFDFTNGKLFPETLHVRKSVPYRFHSAGHNRARAGFWSRQLYFFVDSLQSQKAGKVHCKVLRDFSEFVYERVPIYFVNKNQIGTAIEVQETAYSMYNTIVPDNHIIVPLISKDELGHSYDNWEESFLSYIENSKKGNIPFEYPFDQEICPDICESDDTMAEIEVEALYCPTGGDPECQESNPEIFVYMDFFVDTNGNSNRPMDYLTYVIAHELAHAMMDEHLWEAFLCKNGQTLSKGIPHNSKRYYLFEEGLATAIGWFLINYDKEVAREIMKSGLPYSFGLSPYYHKRVTQNYGHFYSDLSLMKRIIEWLSAKLNDPTPYL